MRGQAALPDLRLLNWFIEMQLEYTQAHSKKIQK